MRRTMLRATVPLALLLGACGASGDAVPTVAPDCADVSGDTSFAVELVDHAFVPACLIVGARQPFLLTNTGEAVHTFTIDDEAIDLEVGPGQVHEAAAGLAIAPGVYRVRCSLHAPMFGTVEVR